MTKSSVSSDHTPSDQMTGPEEGPTCPGGSWGRGGVGSEYDRMLQTKMQVPRLTERV